MVKVNKNKYALGRKYNIEPFGKKYPYRAEFVGYIKLDSKDILPIFTLDFYSYGPPKTYMALQNGLHFECAPNIYDLVGKIKQTIRYVGNAHEFIEIGKLKLSKQDFVDQGNEAGLTAEQIENCVLKGYYSTVQYKGDGSGEIKWCPKCEKIRRTSCSACGCGNCRVCNYRWVCMPPPNLGCSPSNFTQTNLTISFREIVS